MVNMGTWELIAEEFTKERAAAPRKSTDDEIEEEVMVISSTDDETEEIQETMDTAKKWPPEGIGKQADIRSTGKAVIQPCPHIPTPQELELEFQRSTTQCI